MLEFFIDSLFKVFVAISFGAAIGAFIASIILIPALIIDSFRR
jgi:hypothetical protein